MTTTTVHECAECEKEFTTVPFYWDHDGWLPLTASSQVFCTSECLEENAGNVGGMVEAWWD